LFSRRQYIIFTGVLQKMIFIYFVCDDREFETEESFASIVWVRVGLKKTD